MKIKTASALAIIVFCLLSGCGKAAPPGGGGNMPSPGATPGQTAEASQAPEPSPTPTPEPADPIKDVVGGMSVDEKIGQMVLVGLEGTSIQNETKQMIERYRVGGFILYKNNIENAEQTVSMLNQLKAANASNKTPLWLSLDQEGGKVNRLPEEQFKKLPSAGLIGGANDEAYTKRVGEAIGEAVRSLGFNMDFAPVLDINSNPMNPVIGDRSFGADPDTVIRHGLATMEAIQSEHVAAVVKHFPGHGDTSVDSHLDLPVVGKSLSELEAFELLPFAEAVKRQADAIMIAHLLIPAIDKNYPASMSGKVITDLLRNKLAYDGVVITDDMTMGGITKHYDIGDSAVRSVLAGSDIILIGHDHGMQVEVLEALKKSVEEGKLTEERLDESVYRILKLKTKYDLKDIVTADVDVQAVNRTIEGALASGKG
ncbi:beta-N-acetylhexosaminidase [Paenibacillus arenilitoris]|uniref:Beta-N-acetylhexosaminidase n=1 Tax=Paenibacillus arenilitoris TaxID=2772299 RepID=A0A927H828_9BACL|nr:beta-N-acetylhexosaminidase [Paenibacillus arenilitoris]MBD2871142.1 beta-N-acetylhexosaminidase [Paenibacillus arenilitoris]